MANGAEATVIDLAKCGGGGGGGGLGLLNSAGGYVLLLPQTDQSNNGKVASYIWATLIYECHIIGRQLR